MCDIEVCRICLRNESKFFNFSDYNLKKYYEEVTSKSIHAKDGLPMYFCYECAALLYKFHLFQEKCDQGEKILRDMLWNGPLTYAGIYDLNAKRHFRPTHMTLDILICNKRVKTFNYEYREDVHSKPLGLKAELINEDFTDDSDDDNFASNDPTYDPVDLDVPFETDVKDEKDNSTEIKESIIETVKPIDIETQPVVVKIEGEQETEMLENKKPEKSVKVKGNVKIRRTKSKKNVKGRRRKKPEPIYSSDESDDIELSKIKLEKSASIMSPDPKRTYKFNKPKSEVRSLAFLTSENWRKFNLSDEDAMAEFQKKASDTKYLNAPYKCVLCYKGFSQKGMLDRHMPLRHDEACGSLVCRFCKMRFKSNYFLNRHVKQHYNKFECLRCGLVCCLENSAVFHEEYHSGVKRKCPHCDKEFKHLSTFYTHLRTHRSKHMCSLCGESFVSELGLRLHRKAKHRAEISNNVVDIEGAKYCEVCKINFETKLAYQNHLAHSALHTEENRKLGEYIMSEEEKLLEKELNGGQIEENNAKGLVNRKSTVEKTLCAVRKSGKSRASRKPAKKPTTCQHCDESFESLSACLRHHLAEHRGRPFYAERVICEICGASLAVGSVGAHLNQHTRSKMYTCDTCGRSFTTSNILKNHLVTHTGEKKYACTLCDKRFTQNGSLGLHYRTFHLKQPYPKRNRRKNIDKEEEPLLM